MAGVTGSIPVAPTIAHHNPLSDFFSLYSHEFVRVACCVPRTRVADAAYNLAETLRLAGEGDKARTALMVFPGARAVGLRDRRSAAAGRAARRGRAVDRRGRGGVEQALSRPDRRRAAAAWRAGSTTAPSSSIAARSWAWCRRSTCRTTANSTRSAISPRAPTSSSSRITLAGQEVPFGTDLLFRSTGTVPFTFHVEICEDIWVPVPPSSHAALAGAEVLVNLSASNITIGKARDAPPAVRQRNRRAASRPTPIRPPAPASRRPISPGTARPAIFEMRRPARPRPSASRKDSTIVRRRCRSRPHPPGAACATTPSATARSWRPSKVARFRTVDFALDAPREQRGAATAPSSAFPFVPSDPAMLRDNCYEAYNIQVQGLAQRLQATGAQAGW